MSVTEILAAAAPWLIVVCVALLAGAALGYYTAATDLEAEKAKAAKAARAEGFDAGIETAWGLIGTEGRRLYRARTGRTAILADDDQENA